MPGKKTSWEGRKVIKSNQPSLLNRSLLYVLKGWQSSVNCRPRGGIRSIHDRGVRRIFFGLKIYTLGIFWGQEICHVFFQVLKKYAYFFGSYLRANFSFRVFVAISGSEKYSFFSATCVPCSCILLGWKF